MQSILSESMHREPSSGSKDPACKAVGSLVLAKAVARCMHGRHVSPPRFRPVSANSASRMYLGIVAISERFLEGKDITIFSSVEVIDLEVIGIDIKSFCLGSIICLGFI